jgi:hypothetical protein
MDHSDPNPLTFTQLLMKEQNTCPCYNKNWAHTGYSISELSNVCLLIITFPQSQRHRQMAVPELLRSCVVSTATSRPNRCPDISRCPGLTLVWQPQSRIVPRCRVLVSSSIIPPQSHSHSQTVYPFLRRSVADSTCSLPTRNPTPIFALSAIKHPFKTHGHNIRSRGSCHHRYR